MKKKMLFIMLLAFCACSLTFTSCAFKTDGDSVEDNSTPQSETSIVDESFEDIELPEVEIDR